MNPTLARAVPAPSPALALFASVRAHSAHLAAPLGDADATVQSMPDASPAKWHLAHTTWFFEAMVLERFAPGYAPYSPSFSYLFNSYYETLGPRQPRPRRGMITRPSLDEIMAYRAHVDAAIERLLAAGASPEAEEMVELGCHHEQQHQELLLTDILHLFAQNPLHPAYREPAPAAVGHEAPEAAWIGFEGGIVEIGHDGAGFGYDCEGPRHRTLIEPFRLSDRLVTNAEWLAFVEAGGYRDPLLWLSEGWAQVNAEGWAHPLYWLERDGLWWSMTLNGLQPLDPAAPVAHVSYFEADAFAAWAGARLPTEAEWEHAATSLGALPPQTPDARLRPKPAEDAPGLKQMFGEVWQWTRSPFTPYPRFAKAEGAVGEYNGKFMCGQFVLRGSSLATPPGHARASYRNFFQPDKRWQFSGLRLAEDA
ncbi:ergothioneine biosynthesis protein EgtB [Methylopila turkensis]|uniref:Ergothioneine biosynthesis protein EgtB n=1 Tax=Methylopila turkensis TaxID=1437816 RepID=A0A9W6JR35_9HYPH|nr:ergothioneine biosynthesis protein EgtB [Methylopila turkensis]GLK80063.1 ergothioneine biosynthesis protein EgtB [Methylopila turkensis]